MAHNTTRLAGVAAALLLTLMPPPATAKGGRGQPLASMLADILTAERVHPDSVLPYTRRLEAAAQSQTDEDTRLVYALCLGRLYNERQRQAHHAGAVDYAERRWLCFAHAFSQAERLAAMRAKEWLPVTTRGNGDGYFGGDMLSVAWRTMLANTARSVRDTSAALPTYGEIIRFYRGKGNADAVFLLRRDSILDAGGDAGQALLALCGDSPGASGKLVRDQLLRLSDPTIEVDGPAQAYPGKRYTWRLWTRNVSAVRCDGVEHRLSPPSPYDEVEDSIEWEAPLAPGVYTVTFLPVSSAKTTQRMRPIERTVFVSRLRLLHQSMPDGRMRLLVVDSESGKPQEGVAISLYEEGNDSTPYATRHTDGEGKATVKPGKRNTVRLRISTEDETQHPVLTLHHSARWQAANTDTVRRTALFTDRAIYRPGQQLHVGGVAYRQSGWDAETEAAGHTLSLALRDAGGKEVERKTVSCDDMGVFSADFALPADGRTGSWSVRAEGGGGGGASFRVEEYRRPTFTVSLADTVCLLPPDSVVVSGTAMRYDGTPLTGARITGSCHASAWRGGMFGEPTPLDTINTDEHGAFRYRLRRDTLATSLRVQVDALSGYGEQESTVRWYRTPTNPATPGKATTAADSALVLTCPNDTFCLGSPAELTLWSKLSDIYLYYTLSAEGEVVADTLIRLAGDTLRLAIPYRESYGTGAVASFCFVKGGKTYTRTQRLHLRQPEGRLRVRWDTFRDRVKPNSSEEWRLTLLRPDGTPATANLMATLYDAALDHLSTHRWTLGVARGYRLFGMPYSEAQGYRGTGLSHASYEQKRPYLSGLTFGTLNDELFAGRTGGGQAMPLRLAGETRAIALNAKADTTDTAEAKDTAQDEENTMEPQLTPLRQDFSEEAFFAPALRTNERGEVSLVFTLPESLTTWRLLGVAHTRDMLTASVDTEFVACKELTAQLRLPRLLRPGDEAQLTATITNNTDNTQRGKATLQVLSASDGSILRTLSVDVSLGAKADTTYHFPYTAEGEDDVVVRWSVEGDEGSDGEQRLLRTLPATVDVTRTYAFTAINPGTKSISLRDAFPANATSRRLTVEYTTHPEQYALQSLTPLAEARGNDVLSVAAAYYAGKLANALGVGNGDSLVSSHLERLKALQTPEGSFAWYPGMPGSAYLTREVGYLLSRLERLTGDCGDKGIYQKAARCLLAETPITTQVSTDLLRNLYVVQNAGLTLSRAEADKVDSLVALVKKMPPRQTDTEGQALAAIVLKQQGEEKRAREMTDGFVEKLVTVDSVGTYIEYPQGPFASIDRKLHIHVQLMEALQAVRPDVAELAGMRRYLLAQKRTQAWETPVSTANAVFALLNGREPYAPQTAGDVLTVSYDTGEVWNIVAPADSAGGYARDSAQVAAPVRELRLHKLSEGESWGSVHADFRQRFSEVSSAFTGLSATCEYPDGLRTGQRTTATYTIVADRDYDYVTLTVPHPACMETAAALSGYGWCDGLGYYRETRDDRTEYHFHHIPRGHYQLSEDFYVERGGTYHTGVSVVRCDYATEYSGHSQDEALTIQPGTLHSR